MPETNERHELSSNTIENAPQPSPLVEKPIDQTPRNQAAPRQATGPRTLQGKKRTRLNPLKHGLLSKFALLDGESKDEYRSLSIGLQDDFPLQGKLESVLVDYLTVLLWRLRRFIKAESGEITEKRVFMETEMSTKQADEARQVSRDAMASDGLVAHDNNLSVVKEILDTLRKFRLLITKEQFSESIPFINKLYGVNLHGETPDHFRQVFMKFVEAIELEKKQGDQSNVSKLQQSIIETIDGEIEQFSNLKEVREGINSEKVLFRNFATVIPDGGALDRLLRYETHLSREIDRVLNRLERLQRMRTGQPPPPQLDVKIS
jgi:hypothetical protein